MKESNYEGIYEGAFDNRIMSRNYDGIVKDETVTEVWYRLSLEEAKRFIRDNKYASFIIKQGREFVDSWIKLITTECRNTLTGETRRYWSTSLRPYRQGFGCDGTTDLNIHAIANRLAEKHGLDYPLLMRRVYPDDFSESSDFSWLQDEVILAETVIPQEIDPDLAIRDLEQINKSINQ